LGFLRWRASSSADRGSLEDVSLLLEPAFSRRNRLNSSRSSLVSPRPAHGDRPGFGDANL
jgi:hypothetical protein